MISIFHFTDKYIAIGLEGAFKTFLSPSNKKLNYLYIENFIEGEAIKYFKNKSPTNCNSCPQCSCYSKTIKTFKSSFVKNRHMQVTLNEHFNASKFN